MIFIDFIKNPFRLKAIIYIYLKGVEVVRPRRSWISLIADLHDFRFTRNGPCDLGEAPFLVEWNISRGEGSSPVHTRFALWIRIDRTPCRRCSRFLENRAKKQKDMRRGSHLKQFYWKAKCSRREEEKFAWNFSTWCFCDQRKLYFPRKSILFHLNCISTDILRNKRLSCIRNILRIIFSIINDSASVAIYYSIINLCRTNTNV